MSTEIITIAKANILNVEPDNFKDQRLAVATAEIRKIYENAYEYADRKNRQVATILARVADEKSYEQDGFKSVAEYANTMFGIARQNAYALATAGKVYNDEEAPDALKAFSPSKLVEVANVPRETIVAAIENGEISPDSTQKDLREYATTIRDTKVDEKGQEILPQYTARPCLVHVPEYVHQDMDDPRILDDWKLYFSNFIASQTGDEAESVEVVKLSKGFASIDAKKATVTRYLYFNRYMSLVVEFYKYNPKKAKKDNDKLRDFTIDQLRKMLEEAEKAALAPDEDMDGTENEGGEYQ